MRLSKTLLLLLLTSIGCSPLSPQAKRPAPGKDPDVAAIQADTTEVKLAVLEYIVLQLQRPQTSTVLFVALPKTQLEELSRRLPTFTIKPDSAATTSREGRVVDKASGKRGVGLEVTEVKLSGNSATAVAAYCPGANYVFDFALQKSPKWKVQTVSSPFIVE